VKAALLFLVEKMKKVTRAQELLICFIKKEKGIVIESREDGGLIYTTIGGRRINKRSFEIMVEKGLFLRSSDGLLGDSQTYVLLD
jgi:hypothetical protein